MERKGISGSTLKMIAILTMFIDHVGAAFVGRFLMTSGMMEAMGTEETLMSWLTDHISLYLVYSGMRIIGRIAFPIFCFLLVEGFGHTRNRLKYAARLGAFALISEIPFDLAFHGTPLEFSYQNVFFTLFFGLIAMLGCQYVEDAGLNRVLQVLLDVAIIAACMGAVELLKTDYAAKGILCIMALYLFRKNRKRQILAGCLVFFWWELPALIAFIPIALYNGKKGWNVKYFFYLFYPLHLLLIYLVCFAMGMGGIAVV